MTQYGVRLLHVGDAEIPGPQLLWMREWGTWARLAFQVVLIQGEGVTALVGGGMPRDLTEINDRWATSCPKRAVVQSEDQWIIDQLARLEIAPAHITHLIVTPLQLYTTSNIPLFTNARICLAKRGWLHFHSVHNHPHDERWRSIPPDVLSYLTHEAWDQVQLLEDDDEIAPGLRTWWAGSHHRATICLEVDTPNGVVTITDAYFHERNLIEDHPIGICENIYEALSAHDRVRRTAEHALTPYDPNQLDRYTDGIVALPPERESMSPVRTTRKAHGTGARA